MDELDENQMHAICVALGWQGGTYWQALEEIKQLRTERDQRLTLQHHAADMAQRVADLEAERDELTRIVSAYSPLKEMTQALKQAKASGDAARKECYELRARLEMASADAARREQIHGDLEADLNDECDTLRVIKYKLQNLLTELERQEPVAWLAPAEVSEDWPWPHAFFAADAHLHIRELLGAFPVYSRPVHAIPDGWKLVPVELLARCLSQLESDWHQIDGEWGPSRGGLEGSIASGCANEIRDLRAMIAAAPEHKS